ncbi:MAG: pyrroloquinoline quinone biosynthesis protein PqqE, partial [Alphaproteobacteria bacterium]
GGAPAARKDLEALVEAAETAGLYTNLITSGLLLDRGRVAALAAAGLQHVQLSLQGTRPAEAETVSGLAGSHGRKLDFAGWVHAEGLPLTVNAVVHRRNLDRLDEIVALALDLGARRLEVAHVQYHGWAALNREALLPDRAQVARADAAVAAARERHAKRLAIDYVPPDQYAVRPKACMNGWGRQFLVVTPAGRVLPCHAAESLPGIDFPSVREMGLADIWHRSDAFTRYRGTGWMPEPCRSCDRREIDWGGCRCQAFALTGDAATTDPTCALSPHRSVLQALPEGGDDDADFVYRGPRRTA